MWGTELAEDAAVTGVNDASGGNDKDGQPVVFGWVCKAADCLYEYMLTFHHHAQRDDGTGWHDPCQPGVKG